MVNPIFADNFQVNQNQSKSYIISFALSLTPSYPYLHLVFQRFCTWLFLSLAELWNRPRCTTQPICLSAQGPKRPVDGQNTSTYHDILWLTNLDEQWGYYAPEITRTKEKTDDDQQRHGPFDHLDSQRSMDTVGNSVCLPCMAIFVQTRRHCFITTEYYRISLSLAPPLFYFVFNKPGCCFKIFKWLCPTSYSSSICPSVFGSHGAKSTRLRQQIRERTSVRDHEGISGFSTCATGTSEESPAKAVAVRNGEKTILKPIKERRW